MLSGDFTSMRFSFAFLVRPYTDAAPLGKAMRSAQENVAHPFHHAEVGVGPAELTGLGRISYRTFRNPGGYEVS